MRQRRNITWVSDFNALHTCCIRSEVDVALDRLRPRLDVAVSTDCTVIDVSVALWLDAVHVFPLTRFVQNTMTID
jgi:hypothetical protein